MAEIGEERRQFVVPSREELIAEIKQLDDEIEHVSLNLIKCDFNAWEKDVEKTFPDFKFIKINKYNPGSFEVIFEMKIDAINFIRNSYDKKILTRRFFIKMGRQQKEMLQDWACIGYVPRNFKAPTYEKKGHKHSDKSPRSPKEKYSKLPQDKIKQDNPANEKAPEIKKQLTAQTNAPQTIAPQTNTPQTNAPQANTPQTNTPQVAPRPMGKEIPKMEQKPRYKPNYEQKGNMQQFPIVTIAAQKQAQSKVPAKENIVEKKVAKVEVKTEIKTEIKGEKKTEGKTEKVKAEVKKAQVQPKESPKVQVDQDDGWVVVASKTKKR